MDIVRYCKWCGKEFVAHKLQSMYCSHSCINGAYKARKRAERIENFENAQKTTEEQTGDLRNRLSFSVHNRWLLFLELAVPLYIGMPLKE